MSTELDHPKPADYTPDDLLEIVAAYWWQRRWFIAKVMGSAIVVFTILLLLVPNYYRSTATIIIMPPRFQPEVRTQPLSVMTAQTLLQTGEIYESMNTEISSAREHLKKYFKTSDPSGAQIAAFVMMSDKEKSQALGLPVDGFLSEYIVALSASEINGLFEFSDKDISRLTPDTLEKHLTSEETVEKKTATDVVYSPLLTLTAVAESGPKAQVLANAWAFLFEKKYEQLSRQRTQKLYESIQNQQDVSQAELDDIQTSVVRYQAQHNIELYGRQIAEHSKLLEQFNTEMLEKQADLDAQKVRLVQVKELLSGLENQGGWVGELRYDATENGGLAAPLLDEMTTFSETTTGTRIAAGLRKQTLQSRNRLLAAMQRSQEFYRDQPLAMLENQLNQQQKDYTDAVSRLETDMTKKSVLEKSLADLNSKLEQTSKSLVLSTAVPDETIGAAVMESGRNVALPRLASVHFDKEQINPEWQALMDMQVTHGQQLADVAAEITQLQKELPGRKQDLAALQSKVYDARMGESTIKRALDRFQIQNDSIFEQYTNLKDEEFELTKNSFLLEHEVAVIKNSADNVQAQVEEFQRKLNASQADLLVLQSRQRAIQKNVDLLLAKTQEAMIAVRENISDVSISARAIAPELHYFPKRSLLLAVMTFVTAVILLGGLAREKYLQTRPG
jgi:uncharacterized protein involved in exopolysaccharide biosynthesis